MFWTNSKIRNQFQVSRARRSCFFSGSQVTYFIILLSVCFFANLCFVLKLRNLNMAVFPFSTSKMDVGWNVSIIPPFFHQGLLIHTAHVGQTVPNVHLKCQERMALHVIYGTIWLCCRTTSNDMMTAMKYWENISRVGKYWENTGVQIQELKGVGMLAGEGSWRGNQSRTGSSTT